MLYIAFTTTEGKKYQVTFNTRNLSEDPIFVYMQQYDTETSTWQTIANTTVNTTDDVSLEGIVTNNNALRLYYTSSGTSSFVFSNKISVKSHDVLASYQTVSLASIDQNFDDDYRFGFNGQMKDNEVKGIGNSLEFKYRIYDSRLGKFLSVDPLFAKYAGLSTYAYAGNNPIFAKDLEGGEPKSFMSEWARKGTQAQYSTVTAEKVFDKVTNQHWTIFHTNNNPKTYYYGDPVTGANRDFEADLAHYRKTGKWRGSQIEFKTADQQADEQRVKNAEDFRNAMGVGMAFAVAAPVAIYSAPALGLSTLVKGAISTSVQYGLRGEVDIPDVVGDACLSPGFSALLGSTVDITVGGDKNKIELAGMNKDNTAVGAEFVNSLMWGKVSDGLGNTVGSAIDQFGGSTAGKNMSETFITTISTTGEQAVEEKAIE